MNTSTPQAEEIGSIPDDVEVKREKAFDEWWYRRNKGMRSGVPLECERAAFAAGLALASASKPGVSVIDVNSRESALFTRALSAESSVEWLEKQVAELEAALASASKPDEPTEAMLNAARDWSLKKYGLGIGNDAAIGCWKAMYAAFERQPVASPVVEGELSAQPWLALELYEHAINEAEAIMGGEYGDHFGPFAEMVDKARDARAAIVRAQQPAAAPGMEEIERAITDYTQKVRLHCFSHPGPERTSSKDNANHALDKLRSTIRTAIDAAGGARVPEAKIFPTRLRYKNHEGKIAVRTLGFTGRMTFEANEWHPMETWLLEAIDFDRPKDKAPRLFALTGFLIAASSPIDLFPAPPAPNQDGER